MKKRENYEEGKVKEESNRKLEKKEKYKTEEEDNYLNVSSMPSSG
jgi:hypothetical protein